MEDTNLFALDTLTVVYDDGTARPMLPLPLIFEGSWDDLQEVFGPDLANKADGWEPLLGWSNQHGAKDSPVMHPSEFVGEAMRRHMLGRPGYWAVVALLDDEVGDGWAVFYKPFMNG